MNHIRCVYSSDAHGGCVNCSHWTDDGQWLLTGSDDRTVRVWGWRGSSRGRRTSADSGGAGPYRMEVVKTIHTPHRGNIFAAVPVGGSSGPSADVVSGGMDGLVYLHESLAKEAGGGGGGGGVGARGSEYKSTLLLDYMGARVKTVEVDPLCPHVVLVGAENGVVSQLDLRTRPANAGSQSLPLYSVDSTALISLRYMRPDTIIPAPGEVPLRGEGAASRLQELMAAVGGGANGAGGAAGASSSSTASTSSPRRRRPVGSIFSVPPFSQCLTDLSTYPTGCTCHDCLIAYRYSRKKPIKWTMSGVRLTSPRSAGLDIDISDIIRNDGDFAPVAVTAVKDVKINKAMPHYLLVAGNDPFLRVYDRRMLPPLDNSPGRGLLHTSLHRSHHNVLRYSPVESTSDMLHWQASKTRLEESGPSAPVASMAHVTRCDWDVRPDHSNSGTAHGDGQCGTGRHMLGHYHGLGIFVFDTRLADLSPASEHYSLQAGSQRPLEDADIAIGAGGMHHHPAFLQAPSSVAVKSAKRRPGTALSAPPVSSPPSTATVTPVSDAVLADPFEMCAFARGYRERCSSLEKRFQELARSIRQAEEDIKRATEEASRAQAEEGDSAATAFLTPQERLQAREAAAARISMLKATKQQLQKEAAGNSHKRVVLSGLGYGHTLTAASCGCHDCAPASFLLSRAKALVDRSIQGDPSAAANDVQQAFAYIRKAAIRLLAAAKQPGTGGGHEDAATLRATAPLSIYAARAISILYNVAEETGKRGPLVDFAKRALQAAVRAVALTAGPAGAGTGGGESAAAPVEIASSGTTPASAEPEGISIRSPASSADDPLVFALSRGPPALSTQARSILLKWAAHSSSSGKALLKSEEKRLLKPAQSAAAEESSGGSAAHSQRPSVSAGAPEGSRRSQWTTERRAGSSGGAETDSDDDDVQQHGEDAGGSAATPAPSTASASSSASDGPSADEFTLQEALAAGVQFSFSLTDDDDEEEEAMAQLAVAPTPTNLSGPGIAPLSLLSLLRASQASSTSFASLLSSSLSSASACSLLGASQDAEAEIKPLLEQKRPTPTKAEAGEGLTQDICEWIASVDLGSLTGIPLSYLARATGAGLPASTAEGNDDFTTRRSDATSSSASSSYCTRASGYYGGAMNEQTDIKEARFWHPIMTPGGTSFNPAALGLSHCRGGAEGDDGALPGSQRDRGPMSFVGKRGYILAGSDRGDALIFDRLSGLAVAVLKADKDICNGVNPHPFLPVIATTGIEKAVRLWASDGSLCKLDGPGDGDSSSDEEGGIEKERDDSPFAAVAERRRRTNPPLPHARVPFRCEVVAPATPDSERLVDYFTSDAEGKLIHLLRQQRADMQNEPGDGIVASQAAEMGLMAFASAVLGPAGDAGPAIQCAQQ